MFFRVVFFILCLSPLFLTGSTLDHSARCSKGAAPSWIKPYDFPLEAIPIKPSQVNVQYLLMDTQRNWDEKTLYHHFAVRTLTQSGVEAISQLHIDFDPSYAQVIMHAIRVFREGEWFDRLEASRHNVIQRETELEDNLYHGDLTLVYFLDDIRESDVIDYSYSLVGQHPFFASHYTDRVYLQRDFSVEKITHRLLGHPRLSFQTKPINTTIEPKINDLSPHLREWIWEAVDTPVYDYESDQPVWYNPPAHIEMSQYKTWGELAHKVSPLYTLSSDFIQSVPPEMQALVEKWKASTKDLSERALLALRFVQDEVRYLGIEEGMGAFQPNDPNVTFQRRFGDCKDKTFLLHALLHLMDIPSRPLLVHSTKGKRLPDVLPMPFFFNHIVLQLEVDDMRYWVDPTLSLQGGSLQANFFPDYEWGLVIADHVEALTPLPKIVFKNPTEIDTSLILESEDTARLRIKSVFYDSRADRFRRSLKWNGLKKISEASLSNMQEIYGAVTLDSPTETLDDRENNVLTLIASYRLPTQKLSDKKVVEIFSYTLSHYLHNRVNPERATPYAIVYPLWVKERIHIENPFTKWDSFEGEYTQKHESLLYTLITQVEKNSADFSLELKHLQDHIPQTALRDYWNLVNDIDRKAPPTMTIALLPSTAKEAKLSLFYSMIGIAIWISLCLISRKKRPTQDLLSFQLNAFQRFYYATIVLSAIFIGNSPTHTAFIAAGMVIVTSGVCNYIVAQRSVKILLISQSFLGFQACFLFYLIFTTAGVQLPEKILACIEYGLYLGAGLLILNKVKSLLLEEKKASLI